MIYVIGSGPSGVACAAALLEQGHGVTMLDAGGELEGEKVQALENLRQLPPESWRGPNVGFLRGAIAADRMGVKLKLAYGSDFSYRGAEKLAEFVSHNADARPSLAKGGLSNVWGAAMLPYHASDIQAWPISLEELVPHYRGVLGLMDFSATDDGLAGLFPLYTDRPSPLAPSRQATAVLGDMNRRRASLNAAGIWFGSSRLAVRSSGCVYCGLCLYGCPHNLIYNSAHALAGLSRNPDFHYQPGVIVRRLDESGHEVRIEATAAAASGKERKQFIGDRVYLAAGPVASTQILLESLETFDTPLTMLDSCLFLLPLARLAAVSRVGQERLHTLAQAFIEIIDPAVSARIVHIQIYTYNDLYSSAIQNRLGRFYAIAKPAAGGILSRLLAGQCYLHSDFSPSVTLTLSRGKESGGRELRLQGQPAGIQTTAMVDRIAKKLGSHWRDLRMVALKRLLEISRPGRGFHSGGTFPMKSEPGRFQSDVLGRPGGLKRIHVVDSTVFPSIPATTITLSVMANARRIAFSHGQL